MSLNYTVSPKYKLRRDTGFTLVELMITVTIAGILIGLAIPSFKSTIQSNRLTTEANEFVTALNFARSEAVKRGVPVTVRKVDSNSSTNLSTSANWESGWDVFTDATSNGSFDSSTDVLLKSHVPLQALYTLRGDGGTTGFGDYITFRPSGQSHLSGIFVLCDASDNNEVAEANTSRLIMVNAVGRVRMGADTNSPKDNIPNIDTTTNSTDCTP